MYYCDVIGHNIKENRNTKKTSYMKLSRESPCLVLQQSMQIFCQIPLLWNNKAIDQILPKNYKKKKKI